MKKTTIIRFVGNIAMGVFFLLWASSFAVASVPEKWETTGAMATARSNHTAISLPNGLDSMILIVGGTGPSGPLDSAALYNPAANTFSPTIGSMQTARADHTVNFFWGQVLIVGGTGPSGQLNSAELYDPVSKTFSPTNGSMGTARAHHTATLVFGPAVLIAGGTDLSGPLASAELYNPQLKTFSPTGSMTTPRAYHTATPVGPNVLIAGGTGPSGPLDSAALYHPAANTFSPTIGSMQTARAYHTATSLPNGMILIAGGIGPSGQLGSAELYDPVSKTFSPTNGSMQTARAHHTATLLPGGMVLIAGGTGPSGQLDSAELYDPQTGNFSATLPMGSVREQHTANLLVNGKVLLAGGIGSSGQLASAELYCPSVYFNWQFVGPSAYLEFLEIRVDPENENLWYVGSQASGIYVTRNSGNTWEQHLSGIVKALEIDPNNHSVVYASSGSDLYKSADQGVTWSLVYSFPSVISDPVKSPVDSPTIIDSILVSSVYGDIYVGLASTLHHGRVYKSSDGGATWDISFDTEDGLHIWDMEEDPINGYLYFCTENPSHLANALVMRSEDRGESWEDISPLQSTFGHGLKIQVHPVTQHVYFPTESQRVLYRSTDFGDTWTGKNVDINGDLIIDKNYPGRFFGAAIVSGTYVGGVYFSEDTGESFTFGGLAGTTPRLALNGTSTKVFAAAGGGMYVANISKTPPTVTSTNPADAATNVPVNSLITATFSEAMDATTIDATTFTLSGGITGTVTYDPGTRAATFTPAQNLAFGTTYTATITARAKDLAGKSMESDYTWSFTTCSLPSVPFAPTPSNGSKGISTDATLTWSSDNGTSYDVYFGTTSLPPLITTVATPTYDLPPLSYGTTYYWKIVAKNGCGNTTAGAVWSFVTRSLEITPGEGTIGTVVTIRGDNLGVKNGAVLIENVVLKSMSWGSSEIQASLSKAISPGTYSVTVKPKTKGVLPITEANLFTVRGPEIDSGSPSAGAPGETITLSGKFFGNKKGKVYLEYDSKGVVKLKSCKVLSWDMDPKFSDGEIVFVVPEGLPPGTHPLKLVNSVGEALADFTILSP